MYLLKLQKEIVLKKLLLNKEFFNSCKVFLNLVGIIAVLDLNVHQIYGQSLLNTYKVKKTLQENLKSLI